MAAIASALRLQSDSMYRFHNDVKFHACRPHRVTGRVKFEFRIISNFELKQGARGFPPKLFFFTKKNMNDNRAVPN